MRSRYTAFVQGDLNHIQRTYASDRREKYDGSGFAETTDPIEWVRLEILDISGGGEEDETGMVEFAAHYRKGGRSLIHRERSNFRREERRWVYVDGEFTPAMQPDFAGKIGRNQPCPCGSGRKFKKCCGP